MAEGSDVTFYKSIWSRALTINTILGVALSLVTAAAFSSIGMTGFWFPSVLATLPILLIAVMFARSIRGYEVSTDAVWVVRWIDRRRIPLDGLKEVERAPSDMAAGVQPGNRQTNAALFAYNAMYDNDVLGPHQAYATDLQHVVVLRYPDRIVIISPDRPDDFVNAVRCAIGTAKA